MQEMKSIHEPHKTQPPKTHTVILKIMHLPQEPPTPHVHFGTLRNKHIQNSFYGLQGSDSKSHKKTGSGSSYKFLLHSFLMRLKNIKDCKHLKLWVQINIHTLYNQTGRFTPTEHDSQHFTHVLNSVCKPSHVTLQPYAALNRQRKQTYCK